MARGGIPVEPRTNYRCAAWGCPNAGCIDDQGELRPGRCWQHFNEPDRTKWPAITAKVKRNWAQLKNHDGPAPDLPQDGEPSEADMFDSEVPA